MPELLNRQLADVISKIKEDTGREVFSLSLSVSDGNLPLTASKVGGVPYWPRGKAFPKPESAGSEEPLCLLAQLDLSDFGGDPRLPSKGLLQFFVSDDDLCGLDFDKPDSQRGFRVVYHADIDASVTEEDVLDVIGKHELRDNGFPVEKELAVKVHKDKCFISPTDYRFDNAFASACQAVAGWRPGKDEFWWDVVGEDDEEALWDALASGNFGHHILGWPSFTQEDPRGHSAELRKYDELLFQLDTDTSDGKNVMWGDSGVGNFLISSDALAKGDFSNVMYNWDCY